MATSKLLKPTNVTIQIPEFTDQPDQRVNSNCIDKAADAINALNDKIAKKITVSASTGYTVIKGAVFQTGNNVYGAFEIKNSTGVNIPANTWTTIGSITPIPKGSNYSPSVPAANGGNGTYAGIVLVDENGAVRIYAPTAIPNNHSICANISYETA